MIDDIEKRACELLARCLDEWGYPCEAENVREGEDMESYESELRLISQLLCFGMDTADGNGRAALTPPEGHVVVTRNEAGQAVAVTRQDDEGRILSVIAEFEHPQWQPIETAPKDGQYILAFDEDATLVTHWMEGGWYEGEDRYEYFYWEPSHWMSLPSRPETP